MNKAQEHVLTEVLTTLEQRLEMTRNDYNRFKEQADAAQAELERLEAEHSELSEGMNNDDSDAN